MLTGGARLTRSYRYDASGNRTRACSGSTCTVYTYGTNGAGPHAVSAVNGNASGYAYNASGEMTKDAGRSLTWSAFGKALSITRGNTTVTIDYGPGNRRTRKTGSLGVCSRIVTLPRWTPGAMRPWAMKAGARRGARPSWINGVRLN